MPSFNPFRLWGSRGVAAKDGLVNLFGTEAAGTANHNPVTILFPIQDRARSDAELSANIHRNRNLSLRG